MTDDRKTFTREELYKTYGKEIGVAAAKLSADPDGGWNAPDEIHLDRAERIFSLVAERAGMGTMEPGR